MLEQNEIRHALQNAASMLSPAHREVLQYGLERRAAKHPHLRAKEQHLLSAILTPFDVFSIDHSVLEIYGKVRTVLENSGTAIGALDTFIAAQALNLGATVVTSNTKEFARVPGLQIEDWR